MITGLTYTVVGNLTARPELRHTRSSGTPVTRARVAFNPVTRKADGELIEHEAVFHDVQLWGPLAELFSERSTGTAVVVVGEFRTDSYRTKGGEPRTHTYLRATAGGPDLARVAITGVNRPRRDHAPADTSAETSDADFDIDEDVGSGSA